MQKKEKEKRIADRASGKSIWDFSDSNVDSTSTDEDSFLYFLYFIRSFKEKSSGSTTTHVDFSQYDSFIFDLSNDQFPPADRSDFYHEEFADELAQIISQPEYDCFFKDEPELGNFTMDVVGNIFQTKEPRVHVLNVLPTLSSISYLDSNPFSLMLYGSFSHFFSFPLFLLIFSPVGMKTPYLIPAFQKYHSSKPDVSHRSGTFMKFNTYRSHLNEVPLDDFNFPLVFLKDP
ncbi:hypothetical protein Tco_1409700 [Tanacetum coccineum]